MPASRWKDALWKLLDVFAVRRITANVALSAGLLGLATQSGADAGAQPRVPIAPALAPEATVRKFKGRYVLKRSAGSFFIHLAGHRSHSSHSSHASHSSHSSHRSSSHYSGSHFSSSEPAQRAPAPRAPVTPAPEPAPPPAANVVEQAPPPPLRTILEWTRGVLATPPSTFDSHVETTNADGTLGIAPLARQDRTSFSGYVATRTMNLGSAWVAFRLRRHAANATTIFAAAIDSDNWLGFRIEGGRLSFESRTAGRTAARTISYDPVRHKRFRLRTSGVADVVVWETSADGTSWDPQYVETATIPIDALRTAVSAGTTKAVTAPGTAVFDDIVWEWK